jgi:hypothetical protein
VAEAAGTICQPLKPIQTARAEQGWSAKSATSLMPAQRRAGVGGRSAGDDTGAEAGGPGGGVAGCRGFWRVLGLQTRKQWVSTRAPRTEDQAQMVFCAIGRIGRWRLPASIGDDPVSVKRPRPPYCVAASGTSAVAPERKRYIRCHRSPGPCARAAERHCAANRRQWRRHQAPGLAPAERVCPPTRPRARNSCVVAPLDCAYHGGRPTPVVRTRVANKGRKG